MCVSGSKERKLKSVKDVLYLHKNRFALSLCSKGLKLQN